MAVFNDFIMNNIDYVLVVNRDFEIVYSSRFDPRTNPEYGSKMQKYHTLFEMYPSVSVDNSSFAQCMSTGELIYNDIQEFSDAEGKVYVTQNLTFPIFHDGKIAGAVEITKDITTWDHVEKRREGDGRSRKNDEMKILSRYEREDTRKVTFDDILTKDEGMRKAIEQAKISASAGGPTLIYGETGTGKELFAQAMINYVSGSRQKVVVQNCAAVPENLLESILFGTTRGSYTGAENKKGLFEEADGGIIFLDELNALPYSVQGKLLRVVQEGTFRPIGSNREKQVNVKIIAAMNVEPMAAIENNILRKDLFYRLSAGMIYLPPLRERTEDIDYLTDRYIAFYNMKYGKSIKGMSDRLRDIFSKYDWEGNVRELKHVIESMVSTSSDDDEMLQEGDIPIYLHSKIKELTGDEKAGSVQKGEAGDFDIEQDMDLKKALEAVEKKMIVSTLRKCGGNKTKAGKILGIPRQTLKYKMDKWNIEDIEK